MFNTFDPAFFEHVRPYGQPPAVKKCKTRFELGLWFYQFACACREAREPQAKGKKQ